MPRVVSSCLDHLVCSPNERVWALEVMSSYACVWADGGRGCHLCSLSVNVYSETATERGRGGVWAL